MEINKNMESAKPIDEQYYIASVSWGKDSLAMLIELMRRGEPLDEVVFYDTGMEFQAIYSMRDKMLPVLEAAGIKYTELNPPRPFLYDMFEKPVNGKNGPHCGYGWCGGNCRWGTATKTHTIDKYGKNSMRYIGIAADEHTRLERPKSEWKLHPLATWGITEADALAICYEYGFTWDENGIRLYDILDRVSCWCCRNKNLKELKNIYLHMPGYWERLKELQHKLPQPMKGHEKSVFDLEKRFREETKP